MRSRYWLAVAAAVGLLGGPAVAQQVVFDFESPTYAAGNLNGQDGWVETESQGGVALVIDSDNGPSAAGSQCLELNNLAGYDDGRIRVDRAFADVIAAGGRLVTFKYDLKRADTDVHWTEFRIPGARTGHWWDNWSQWQGYSDIAGNGWGWDSWNWPVNDDAWHTVEWVILYGDSGSGEDGLLLSASFDGVETEETGWIRRYMGAGYPEVVDSVYLKLDEAFFDGTKYDDVLYLDNIVVRGEPSPSDIPVADAGPDVTQIPGSWDGVTLDGSASSDDGEIVRYRWSLAGSQLYNGPNPTVNVFLGEGVHQVMLEVIDDDGLRNADMVTYTIGELPAILDQVAGPWGIRNGDIYGTNSSTEIPINTSSGEIEILNIVHYDGPWSGLPGEHNGHVVFDRAGNLYFNSWNDYVQSFSPDLVYRWTSEVRLGDGGEIGNSAVIVGIRYVYAVGGAYNNDPNIPAGEPAAYAFQKNTGQLVWQTQLVGEDWSGHNGKPKLTLYNDKLYVVGENIPINDGTITIHQIDATTGNLDWQSECRVEMQWDQENNPGSVALVPDAYGTGLHGMFFNQMSEPSPPAYDGYADMVALKIDATPSTGGATVVWGPNQNIDGPGLNNSHPIYSPTTRRVYTPSTKEGDWPYSMYGWNLDAGSSPDYQLYGTHAPEGDVGHGYRDNFVLDFDGMTIHAPGEFDSVRSYTDQGDGTFSMVYREYGGFDVNGWGFRSHGALLQDQNGDSILLVATEGGDPNSLPPAAPKVVAVNLSEPPPDPNDPVCTPVASIVVSEWDDENLWWTYPFAQYGPTPGPDGSFYIFQNRGWNDNRIVRLRFVESGCVADLDGDGDTDLADLAALLGTYGKCPGDPGYNPAANLVENDPPDGCIDLADLAALLGDYGCVP